VPADVVVVDTALPGALDLLAQARSRGQAVVACGASPVVADDFEFVHDKWGRSARPQFLDAITLGCQRQKAGTDFKARRELVPGTMSVHLINNYGALQMGTHRFFAVREGQKDRLTETGRFIHLWKLDNGTWTLARAISYDHQLAK
jgi:hypothetical protein